MHKYKAKCKTQVVEIIVVLHFSGQVLNPIIVHIPHHFRSDPPSEHCQFAAKLSLITPEFILRITPVYLRSPSHYYIVTSSHLVFPNAKLLKNHSTNAWRMTRGHGAILRRVVLLCRSSSPSPNAAGGDTCDII